MWAVFALPILLCWPKKVAKPNPQGVCLFRLLRDPAFESRRTSPVLDASENEHSASGNAWVVFERAQVQTLPSSLSRGTSKKPICWSPRVRSMGYGGFPRDSVSSPIFWTWVVLREDQRTLEILRVRSCRNSDYGVRGRKKMPAEQQLKSV